MKNKAKKRWFALIILLLCAVVIGLFYWNGQKKMQSDEGYLVKYSLLFTPVSITPLIDTEDARFDLNASRPIAKGDLKWRDALLVAHRVNSNLSHSCFSILRCLHRTFRIYFLIFIRIWSEEHEQKEDQ